MKGVDDVTSEVRELQVQQRRSNANGSEKMKKARERIRKRSEALKRPRDRHLDKKRMLAALREMSKDLDRLERGFEGMKERDAHVTNLLDERRDLLLRDCFELKKLVDSRKLFEDVGRLRSLGEPLGGWQFASILPDWAPVQK